MEDQTFDRLARSFAAGSSRRRLLKVMAGGAAGALAGVFGTKRSEAVLAAPEPDLCPGGGGPDNKICHCPPGQDGGNCTTTGNGGGHSGSGHEFDCCCLVGGVSPNPDCICPSQGNTCCKPAGTTCASNANCCSNAPNCCGGICQVAACPQCVTAATCPPSTDQCKVAVCSNGVCGFANKSNGTACNDGNACTQTDTCQAGVCTGANPVVCSASDPCHVAGVCDTATGLCSNPNAQDGTPCNDGNACTQTDTCQGGTCTGGDPVVCSASDQCHVAGTCDPATGFCTNPNAVDGTPCEDGRFCTAGDTCQGGSCTGGPIRDCSAGLTDQCNTGVCDTVLDACVAQPVNIGLPCDDEIYCTTGETCQPDGSCGGGGPRDCSSLGDDCNLGVCDTEADACVAQPVADGTACDTDNLCTADSCQQGVCTEGALNVNCASEDPCLISTCNPVTGLCDITNAEDGTPCDDGDACTQADACVAGLCVGSDPVVCTALDQCHDIGTCDPDTGVCSDPVLTGIPCNDGQFCTTGETCQEDGSCGGGGPTDCSESGDECNDGVCDEEADACVARPVTDGTSCDDGLFCTTGDACVAGKCTGGPPPDCSGSGDRCNVGVCDTEADACVAQPVADGTACDTDNLCTADTCQQGVCTEGDIDVTCSSDDPCQVSTCDPATGMCMLTDAEDGTPCDDGDLCTTGDACAAGVCVGTAKICTALDQCHVAGTCDSSTGICSNPLKAVGTPCNDGNGTTCDETCQADGTCGGGAICACTADESPKRCIRGGPEYTCKRCAGVTSGSVQVVCDRTNVPSCICNSKTCTVNGQTIKKGQPVPACTAVTCDARPPA